ncbi:MAG: hypothetical protein WAK12_09805 [Acidimicrobiales bacterium]
MQEQVIIIEERLRTKGLVLTLLGVAVIFVGGSITLATRASSPPATFYIIESVVVILLITALLMFARITVRVVEAPLGRTLEVVYGPGGLIRQVFGPDRLVAAQARNYSILQMGGWGYRGSLTLIRRAAMVTRRGEALDVQLKGKRRFIVTVENPDDFVRALGLPS